MPTALIIAVTTEGYTACAARAIAAGFTTTQHLQATRGADLVVADPDIVMNDRTIVSAEAAYSVSKAAAWPSCGTVNAVGCMLSHVAAWRIVATSAVPVVILEEDAAWSTKTAPAAIARVTQPYDVLMLGGRLDAAQAGAVGVIRIADRVYCSEAYVVTPAGAAKLLAGALPVQVQIDAYLGARAAVDTDVYALRPALAHQLPHTSTVQVLRKGAAAGAPVVAVYAQSSSDAYRSRLRPAAAAAVGSKRARVS